MASRKPVVVAFFGLALLLRLAAVFTIGHRELLRGEFELKNDESTYHRPAAALTTEGCYCWAPGGHPTAYRPPGIILPIAALYEVFGPAPRVALAYVLVCSLGLVAVIRALAGVTSRDVRVVNAATLIAAVMPTLLWTSSGIWSDAPALLFTLLTLWLVIRQQAAWWTWLAIGFSAAMAYLNRPSAVIVFPILFGASMLRQQAHRRSIGVVLLTLSLALPIGAWGFRNHYALGEFYTGATVAGPTLWESNNPVTAGLTSPAKKFANGVDLYAEANAGHYLGSWVPAEYIPESATVDVANLPEMEVYHRYVDLTLAFVREHPSAVARLMFYKAWRLFSAEPVAASISGDSGSGASIKRAALVAERWFLFFFGALGFWNLYRTRASSRHFYAAFALAGLASVFVAYVNARLLLPFTGVLVVPAAVGVLWLRDRLFLRGR